MGLQMKMICIGVCIIHFFFMNVCSQEDAGGESTAQGTVFVDGKSGIGFVDSDYVCATLDWWPPEKCDYGTCSWGKASLLNLVLTSSFFFLLNSATCHLLNPIYHFWKLYMFVLNQILLSAFGQPLALYYLFRHNPKGLVCLKELQLLDYQLLVISYYLIYHKCKGIIP